MGRYFNTDKSEFLEDEIYQPDYDYMGALADSKVKLHQGKQAIEDFGGLAIPKTFQDWQGNMDEAVQGLDTKFTEVSQRMAGDLNNPQKYIKEINQLRRETDEAFSSGPIGVMGRQYQDVHAKYNEMLAEKDITPAQIDRINEWYRNTLQKVKDNVETPDKFSPIQLEHHVDDIEAIKKVVKNEDFKYSAEGQGGFMYTTKNAQGRKVFAPIPVGAQVKNNGAGLYFTGADGKSIPVVNATLDGAQTFADIITGTGLKYKKAYLTSKIEGYMQEPLFLASMNALLNDPAVINKHLQDYNDFQRRRIANGQSVEETAEDYLIGKITESARTNAESVPNVSKRETSVNIINLTEEAALEKAKIAAAAKEASKNKAGLTPEEVKLGTVISNTPYYYNSYVWNKVDDLKGMRGKWLGLVGEKQADGTRAPGEIANQKARVAALKGERGKEGEYNLATQKLIALETEAANYRNIINIQKTDFDLFAQQGELYDANNKVVPGITIDSPTANALLNTFGTLDGIRQSMVPIDWNATSYNFGRYEVKATDLDKFIKGEKIFTRTNLGGNNNGQVSEFNPGGGAVGISTDYFIKDGEGKEIIIGNRIGNEPEINITKTFAETISAVENFDKNWAEAYYRSNQYQDAAIAFSEKDKKFVLDKKGNEIPLPYATPMYEFTQMLTKQVSTRDSGAMFYFDPVNASKGAGIDENLNPKGNLDDYEDQRKELIKTGFNPDDYTINTLDYAKGHAIIGYKKKPTPGEKTQKEQIIYARVPVDSNPGNRKALEESAKAGGFADSGVFKQVFDSKYARISDDLLKILEVPAEFRDKDRQESSTIQHDYFSYNPRTREEIGYVIKAMGSSGGDETRAYTISKKVYTGDSRDKWYLKPITVDQDRFEMSKQELVRIIYGMSQ